MHKFEYAQAETIDEATQLLSDESDALVIAGGTATVVLLNLGLLRPSLVVDIGGVGALHGAGETDGNYHLGALASVRALETSEQIKSRYPILAEAAAQVGSVRVRNAATVGGAIAYGEPQTDVPVALVALGASVEVVSRDGKRRVSLADFFHAPYETDLAPGELVTQVEIPPMGLRAGGCHVKFTVGSIEHKPVANVSTIVRLDAAGVCEDVRIVAGAVGPTPFIAERAAAMLRGAKPSDREIGQAARAASEGAEPIDDLRGSAWYKRRIVKVLVERGLQCAILRAKASM